MRDLKVLEKMGCTKARLREIFTAPTAPEGPAAISLDRLEPPRKPKSDGQIRRRFESRIRSRILEGIGTNIRRSRAYQAVDMACDAPPIQREMIPLMLWAQGKINQQQAQKCITQCATPTSSGTPNPQGADQFFAKNAAGKITVNIPRITDFSVDLTKSYVQRRLASLNAQWSNIYPLFKYDPRGVDDIALLRGDVLTQRVDIMADDYGYRHFFGQCRRQMLEYGFSVAFPRCAWDKKTSWRFKKTNTGQPTEELESYVVKEGIDFVAPHPSRIAYDLSAPLANLNNDNGPSWILYWDIRRYGDLLDSGADYYNINQIFVSDGWIEIAQLFSEFWYYYFDPKVLAWPSADSTDPTLQNDRECHIGRYTSEAPDQGVLTSVVFDKINPLQEGIGRYDGDVWLRMEVAGDCTVINAEFMPSIPGAYGGINQDDNRLANQSFAMSLLSFQDAASNIVSHMLMQLRSSLVQLWLIDQDSLDKSVVDDIKANAQNQNWWVDPHVLIYSATKLRELGILDPKTAFFIVQSQITGAIQAGLTALGQLLNLCDRLIILSPNEQGQPNPREVSAREVSEVASSVQAINSFINEGPREQVAAVKEMIYESLIVCATESVRVPIEKRYTKEIIEKAGFKIPDTVKVDPEDDLVPVNSPVMGNLRDLEYDYYFDSRDGAERVLNSDGAKTLVQLWQFLNSVPGVIQAMGVENLFNYINLIIRMIGAPTNFQLDIPRGTDAKVGGPTDDQASQMAQSAQAMQQAILRIEQVLTQVLHVPPQAFQGQPGGGGPGQPPPGQNGAHPPGPAAPGGPAAPAPQAGPPAQAGHPASHHPRGAKASPPAPNSPSEQQRRPGVLSEP